MKLVLPEMTHQQSLFLAMLASAGDWLKGKKLRADLRKYGLDRTGARFFGIVRRLLADGLVEKKSDPDDPGPYQLPESLYRLTPKGKGALETALQFAAGVEIIATGKGKA